MSGPVMGDLRVALRSGPSSVASFGRVTHAPADSNLYRMILGGQIYISLGRRLGSMEIGSIRHPSQNFLSRAVERRNFFKVRLGRGRRVGSSRL